MHQPHYLMFKCVKCPARLSLSPQTVDLFMHVVLTFIPISSSLRVRASCMVQFNHYLFTVLVSIVTYEHL